MTAEPRHDRTNPYTWLALICGSLAMIAFGGAIALLLEKKEGVFIWVCFGAGVLLLCAAVWASRAAKRPME